MNKNFFMNNRLKLNEVLPNTFIVITAHTLMQYSADIAYPFRQESNFWYLTGLELPDVLLLIDTSTGESTLLFSELNDYQMEWDGVIDTSDLKAISGISSYDSKGKLAGYIKTARKNGLKIGYFPAPPQRVEPYGFYANPAKQHLNEQLSKLVHNDDLIDISLDLARLRSVKQPEEIECIKLAVALTATTLKEIKKNSASYKNEKDIERAVTRGFYMQNGDGHGYEPIIASGKNASIIHYQKNCAPIAQNELLLLDVGARVKGYSADISRTWIVGTPTKRQKEVYEACLRLQQEGLELLKPGVYLRDVQEQLEANAQKEFKELQCSMYGEKFPHGFSHFLGFDVHDAGDYSAPLKKNMVLTMEPGIYLRDEGIGVRIEDDVLITKSGIENLSEMIPKVL